MVREAGKTKDAGFQFGLQRTFPVTGEEAWDFMVSDRGLKIWLGDLVSPLELKRKYLTKSGIHGLVRVFKPYSHLRMNWKKNNWENMSTLQIRTIGNSDGKSIISFHQEKLTDAKQRAEMKEYWNRKMDDLATELRKASR